MNFVLSKLFWICFPPLNLTVLLLAGGFLVRMRWLRTGQSMLALGVILFVVSGVLPTGMLLLRGLESQYAAPENLPKNINGILVLGGSFDVETSAARHATEFSSSGERVTEAVHLMHLYPKTTLVFSGGNGTLNAAVPSESTIFKNFLANQDVSDSHVKYEDRSRNTYENIIYSVQIAKPGPKDTWILVTSAAHMPRAIALMMKLGWKGWIVPYPVDYQTRGTTKDYALNPDILGNYNAMHLAAREYLALLAYRLGGRIGGQVNAAL